MADFAFSKHARDMMDERNILEDWVWRTLREPETSFTGEDGNQHFTKTISERENRILHVVVNPNITPKRIVTLFFDRRLRNKK